MVLPSLVTVLLSSILSFWKYPFDDPNMPTTPTYQFQAQAFTDISSLLAYHDSLVIEDKQLTFDTYTSVQPTHSQRVAWRNVVTSLLNIAVDDADGNSGCSSVHKAIPDVLQGIYTVAEVDNGRFCALVEVDTVRRKSREEYAKGWGLFVVPTKRDVSGVIGTALHLSAPHPVYDMHTGGQAAHVFEQTGAKSLYVAGRSRLSFHEQTDCIVDPGTKYWKTDPAHDKGEMMFETYRAIVDWQKDPRGGGGCLDANSGSTSCAYVQFHGKGKKTCRKEKIFLSAGLGRDPESRAWYTEPSHSHFPIHRLSTSLRKHFPSLSVTIPTSPRSTCILTATKNIVGRLINGVPEDRVCMESATAEGASGTFVHIEQDIESRKKEAWGTWVEVFLDAFKPQAEDVNQNSGSLD